MQTRRQSLVLRAAWLAPAALLFALGGSLCLSHNFPPATKMSTAASISTTNMTEFRAQPVQTAAGELPQSVRKFVLQQHSGDTSIAERWRTLSFEEVVALWQSSSSFAEVFAASLAAVPFEAIFWESAPVTGDSMVRTELPMFTFNKGVSQSVTRQQQYGITGNGGMVYHSKDSTELCM